MCYYRRRTRFDERKSHAQKGLVLRGLFTQKYGLPAEVIWMAIQHLELDDVSRSVVAFGVELVSYWMQMFPADLIFEARGLVFDQIDWVSFVTGIVEQNLTARGTPLWNRRRIFKRVQSLDKYIEDEVQAGRSCKNGSGAVKT